MVMPRYGCCLKDWRAALPVDAAPQLRLYLTIFADVLRAVQVRGCARACMSFVAANIHKCDRMKIIKTKHEKKKKLNNNDCRLCLHMYASLRTREDVSEWRFTPSS